MPVQLKAVLNQHLQYQLTPLYVLRVGPVNWTWSCDHRCYGYVTRLSVLFVTRVPGSLFLSLYLYSSLQLSIFKLACHNTGSDCKSVSF